MGYVDPLGRFIRDPDVDSLDGASQSNRKTSSNPLTFLSNLVRNDQDELVRHHRFPKEKTNSSTCNLFRRWKKQLLVLPKHSSMKSHQ